MNRPVEVGDPGWPRPRVPTAPPPWRLDAVPQTLPAPWVAMTNDAGDAWNPAAYDGQRAARLADDDLCQVCGGPRGATVYALAGDATTETDDSGIPTRIPHAGGALCSERCARLTAAVCPHYRRMWPVRVFAVPHPGPRTSMSGLREIDDVIDTTSAAAILVATIGESS